MASKVNDREDLTEERAEDTYVDTEFHEDGASRELEVGKNTDNVEETKQKRFRGEGAPFVMMVAFGTIEDLPEVIKKVEEVYGIHSVRRSVVVPAQSEEERATKIVGKEILGTSDEVKDSLLRGCTKEERKRLADAVIEFTSTIYTNVVAENMPDIQVLTQAFDSALDALIRVPVAEQNTLQLLESFLKLAVFSMSVISLGKQCLKNGSTAQIALIIFTVGNVMFKIADKHGLYKWMKDNGGMSGLRVRICNYIRQLISGNTVTDSNNAVSIPWPSNNTIILFGTLTVFVAYFSYKYR